ncbi:hypothetical protein [Shinella sp. BYT-45]|uniref:hypothetical protein n=1 Tax=Shinella sp. BYT-45 TaxID=3377377 RepID=UPI00397FFAAF
MSDYLSEELKALARRLSDHDHEGLVMSGDEVGKLARRLRHLADASVLLECEVSRHRWNMRARQEREAREELANAIDAPGSNIVKFPGGRA